MTETESPTRRFRCGRVAPARPAHERLRFASYRRRRLPTPPASCDWTPAAAASLADVMKNDRLGCCVVAAGYHYLGASTGNAGGLFVPTDQQVVSDYSAIGGYVPGRPATDQGCDEQTALDYWTSHGFADGTKLAGWLAVDAGNVTQLKQCLWLFEGLLFGFGIPDAIVNNEPQRSGFVWDLAGPPDPNNGHAIVGLGYTKDGVIVSTWGMTGLMTWRAVAAYMTPAAGGDCYTMLTPAQVNKAQAKAPNGFDWLMLVDDFNAMGGNLPVPSPPPSPPPAPAGVNPGLILIDTNHDHVFYPDGWTAGPWPAGASALVPRS